MHSIQDFLAGGLNDILVLNALQVYGCLTQGMIKEVENALAEQSYVKGPLTISAY